MEEWKVIKGYDGKYSVSSEGRVKKNNGKFIKPVKRTTGYYVVGLWQHQECSQKLLHRLVAFYFIENPDNLPEVNHKDGNKANNAVSNLEWVTHSENQQHRIKILHKDMIGENNPMYGKSGVNSPRFKDFILQIDMQGNIVNRFESALEAARFLNGITKYNIGASAISSICNHKRNLKTYKGFVWMYEQEFKQISGFKTL